MLLVQPPERPDRRLDHNAERAREEQRLGLGGKKKARVASDDGEAAAGAPEEKPAGKKKTGKGKKPSVQQGKLF